MRARASLPMALVALLLASGTVLAGEDAVVSVEGGAFFDYVAPDPGTPTDGAIRFGFDGAVETIAADALLVPPADTNLEFLNGGTPTCLAVTRAVGVITRIAFMDECTISGDVELVEDLFGPDADGYLIDGRIAAPAEFLATDPAFAALIGVPAAAGTTLTVTFTLDPSAGFPVSFVGTTSVSGPVTILGNGDVTVGAATLPSAVIDDASREALAAAAALGVDATVAIRGDGNLQVKSQVPELVISLTVTYTAPPPSVTPAPSADLLPDTQSASGVSSARPGTLAIVAGLLLVASATLVVVRVRRP